MPKKPTNQRVGTGQRLTEFRTELGLSQRDAAKMFGVGRQTWTRYELGNVVPKKAILALLANAGLNIHWLHTGEGPMLLEGEALEAHSLMVRDVHGNDPEARQMREERATYMGANMFKAQQTIERLAAELGFDLGVRWYSVLVHLLLHQGLSETGAAQVINQLKFDHENRKDSPKPD